jgi:hypothetical protein
MLVLFFLLLFGAVIVAAAKGKPGLALLAVGMVLLFVPLSAWLGYVNVRHASNEFSSAPNMAEIIQATERGETRAYIAWGRPSWIGKGLVIAAVLIGGLLLARHLNAAPRHVDQGERPEKPWQSGRTHGGGWWKAIVVVLMLAVVLLVGMRFSMSYQSFTTPAQVADEVSRQGMTSQRLARQVRVQAQRGVNRAQQNIEELIDNFDKPRIALEAPQPAPANAPGPTAAEQKLSFEEAKNLLEQEPERAKAPATTEIKPSTPTAAEKPNEGGPSAATTTAPAAAAPAPATPEPVPAAVVVQNKDAPTPNIAKALKESLENSKPRPKDSILRIQFDRNRMIGQGISFGQVVTAFLSKWPEANGPVRIDGQNAAIEVNWTPSAASEFAKISINNGRRGNVLLSQLTETITSAETTTGRLVTDGNGRPDWVDDPPTRTGDVWRRVVVSDEYSTPEECYRHVDSLLMYEAEQHMNSLLDGQYSFDLERLGLGLSFVRREVVPQNGEYLETVQRSVGPMYRLYTRMEFTPQVDARMRSAWTRRIQTRRVEMVSALGAMALAGIGLVYGLLQVDTWTKGYYSKRLFLGVPALIIGIIALFSLLVS